MALDLNDKTSNGNTLTNVNTVTEETSSLPFLQSTSAASFASASSQTLTANDSATLSVTGAITVEFWVNFTTTPGTNTDMNLVSKWDNEGTGLTSRSYQALLRNSAGTLKLTWNTSSNGGNSGVKEAQWNWTPSTGTWYHLAFTNDTSGNVIAYIDGSAQSTVTSQNTSISDQSQKLWLGAVGDGLGGNQSFLNGKMDDVRVWSVVRTGTEITNNRSVELTGSESNLIAYWPFETELGSAGGARFLLNFV